MGSSMHQYGHVNEHKCTVEFFIGTPDKAARPVGVHMLPAPITGSAYACYYCAWKLAGVSGQLAVVAMGFFMNVIGMALVCAFFIICPLARIKSVHCAGTLVASIASAVRCPLCLLYLPLPDVWLRWRPHNESYCHRDACFLGRLGVGGQFNAFRVGWGGTRPCAVTR